MRIWSLHPHYLDTKGLVAVWRETLLAKHVLEGKTKGYTQHPQLLRFKNSDNGLLAINQYLSVVFEEAEARGYHFNSKKFQLSEKSIQLSVTNEQLKYEFGHLLEKLKKRDHDRYLLYKDTADILTHPLFEVIPGDIESWEILPNKKSDKD
jgi:hypothetical protein